MSCTYYQPAPTKVGSGDTETKLNETDEESTPLSLTAVMVQGADHESSDHLLSGFLPDIVLPHTALNSDGKATMILIHGAFSTRHEWDLVTPFLSGEYHLLVPDLPGHGELRDTAHFSVQTSSTLLARLICEKAHNGIAHVIGLSLGAHIAIDLASHYPNLVNQVLVSGFEVFPSTSLSPYVPYVLWTMQRVESFIPRRIIRLLMDGADIQEGSRPTLELCKEVGMPLAGGTPWPGP